MSTKRDFRINLDYAEAGIKFNPNGKTKNTFSTQHPKDGDKSLENRIRAQRKPSFTVEPDRFQSFMAGEEITVQRQRGCMFYNPEDEVRVKVTFGKSIPGIITNVLPGKSRNMLSISIRKK